MDVKKLGVIPPGGGHRVVGQLVGRRRKKHRGYDYLHVAIDDASRVAFVAVLPDETERSAITFVLAMDRFFAAHGVRVERLMTDQNRTYRVSRAFHTALAELGIEHRMTRPYRPQTNGKAERFIQTLLAEWTYLKPYRNNARRLAVLPRWVAFYNLRRTHSELGNLPPLTVLVNKVRGNYT
jgi:transposase InsO family protein